MFSGWLVYNQHDAIRNHDYIEWMKRESSNIGMNLNLVYRHQIRIGIRQGELLVDGPCTKPDFAIVRIVEPILTEQLELTGVPVFNNSHVARLCNDKALTHQYLAGKGIPMLDAVFFNTATVNTEALDYPFVAKIASGRGGKQVHFISNTTGLTDFLQKYPDKDALLQRVGPIIGKDVRVFVVGNSIIAAVLRSSRTDFRANYSLGGSAEIFHLNVEQKLLVQRVISEFGFGLVGIDFLLDNDGKFYMNEIEDVVGSRTLSSLNTRVNLVREYLEHIKQKISGVGGQ